jgi:putative DNA primase/helicase
MANEAAHVNDSDIPRRRYRRIPVRQPDGTIVTLREIIHHEAAKAEDACDAVVIHEIIHHEAAAATDEIGAVVIHDEERFAPADVQPSPDFSSLTLDGPAALDWALRYASIGMAVYPVGANRQPVIAGGHGFRDASTDPAIIAAWWAKWPYADIGWAVPADVLAVDLDAKKGKNGYRDFEEKIGLAADNFDTPQASSPTGGRHLYFRANGVRYQTETEIERLGIDLRTGGESGGGMVLPGPGNGRKWLRPLSGPWMDAPAWFAERAQRRAAERAARPTGDRRPFHGETERARKALDQACRSLAAAGPGERDKTVGDTVLKVGSLAAAGELDRESALDQLDAAARSCQGAARDYPDKVKRAFEKGFEKPAATPQPVKKVTTIMGSKVKPQAVVWLWPNWLAHGKLHILAGRPGALKTTTALGFGALVSIGGFWPDGSQAAIGKTVIWSGEDAIDDTLLPRFLAAGGDPDQIFFVSVVEEGGKKRSFDPATDIAALEQVCADLGDVNLIIVDPIVAVTKATTDSHKNAEARRDLQPLVTLAERTQAAVIGIHHLTKGTEGKDPVDRVSGSLAFGAGPRVVLLSALDYKAGGEPRGVLMRAKNNLGPSHGGFRFAASTLPLAERPDISAQRIEWLDYVNEPARDILAKLEGRDEQQKGGGERKAATFLRIALNGRGPRMAAEVIKEGEAHGLSQWALRRALKKLGGSQEKPSFGTGWVWELPQQAS